ncbi:uncharacterized protein FA14DRAFT_121019 [Meira miltonrushii]|uniref:Nicotinamide N-methyltransferase n=1 Tax=Meira miltonrushii TaxID=1280837 RepID=A0A316VEA3_9BASI|nr:uncharacterized protein FA14DRAFT_121019 [Meira miltonrushii]PWN35912.1 hypothetical protein FA14DRAFT_121019 [Meira miltonrushii]
MGDAERDDTINFFESSIESLFGHHQSATGEAGQLCTLQLDDEAIKYRIPASNTNKLFAHYQWDAGLFLGRLIHKNTDIRQTTVLELGAGTGIPGLISAKHGASSVLITDYPDEGILTALNENIQFSSVQKNAKALGLDWADKVTTTKVLQEYPDKFERILCADVLWLSSSHQPLLNTILSMLARTSTAKCIVVSGFHTGRRALSKFFAMACSKSGLQSQYLRTSKDSHGRSIVFEFNVVTNKARPWSGRQPFAQDDGDEEEQDNMDDFTERTKWLLYVCLEWNL